ncbi:MAG: cupin domain-containing protein [FCB group bacterium]|nr:cupin domain-containing protein [FCB group bacterium]
MKIIKLNEGRTYQPDPGWKRVALAGSDNVSIEYFEKPPGHTSPLHQHANEQTCIAIEGQLKVVTESGEESILEQGDSAWFAPDEPHRVENAGNELAKGIDIFVPGRSFDFWLNKLKK